MDYTIQPKVKIIFGLQSGYLKYEPFEAEVESIHYGNGSAVKKNEDVGVLVDRKCFPKDLEKMIPNLLIIGKDCKFAGL